MKTITPSKYRFLMRTLIEIGYWNMGEDEKALVNGLDAGTITIASNAGDLSESSVETIAQS